jgi:hypothetical protein
VIVPETVTDTILPFGGHNVDELAAIFTAGGVASIPNNDVDSGLMFPAFSIARSPTL